MGANAEVKRHDGTPPGEDEIAARMRAEGCSRTNGATALAIPTAGMSTATKRCSIACAAGSCSTPPAVTSISARETRWSSRRTPRTRQRSARRAGAASKRSVSETRARLTGSATRETCTMTCRGPYVPHRGMSGHSSKRGDSYKQSRRPRSRADNIAPTRGWADKRGGRSCLN